MRKSAFLAAGWGSDEQDEVGYPLEKKRRFRRHRKSVQIGRNPQHPPLRFWRPFFNGKGNHDRGTPEWMAQVVNYRYFRDTEKMKLSSPDRK